MHSKREMEALNGRPRRVVAPAQADGAFQEAVAAAAARAEAGADSARVTKLEDTNEIRDWWITCP
jgi:hypothetical protein